MMQAMNEKTMAFVLPNKILQFIHFENSFKNKNKPELLKRLKQKNQAAKRTAREQNRIRKTQAISYQGIGCL